MLKLERIAKTDEINVLIRSKPSLLNRPFLYALTYAILFHLSALLIFQIAPFKLGYQQSLFPPVRVASEVPSSIGIYATNAMQDDDMIPSYLIAPLPPIPELPSFEDGPLVRNMEYIQQSNPLSNPFLAL